MSRNKFNLQLPLQPESYQNLLEKRLREKYSVIEPKQVLERLDTIIYILKNMNHDDIIKLYKEFYKEISEFKIEYVFGEDPDREIIEIINPPELAGKKFYKSSGTSRSYSLLKDFWLPYTKIEGEGKIKKIRKTRG